MPKKRIYLDANATTPPRPSAINGAKKAFDCWGNPSSVHQHASSAKALLWSARKELGHFLNCHPLEIIFTSGASEANNHVLKTLFENPKQTRNELVISSVEHPSLIAAADFLSDKGFTIHKIPVSKQGFLDEDFFNNCLSKKTLLVSVMAANNETGILFPIKKLAKKTHEKGGLFHSDMVQMLGKIPIDLTHLNIDLASFSAHKCYSLKGCGILYCKKGINLNSFIHGGPQERNRRAGTENIVGISAFGAIAKEKNVILKHNQKLQPLRDAMEKKILSSIPRVQIVGQKTKRLGNTSCFYISGIEGETLMMNLDLKGISVSVGSACGSGKIETVSSITAMGWSNREAKSMLRVSLSLETTKDELDYFQITLKNCIKRLRSLC